MTSEMFRYLGIRHVGVPPRVKFTYVYMPSLSNYSKLQWISSILFGNFNPTSQGRLPQFKRLRKVKKNYSEIMGGLYFLTVFVFAKHILTLEVGWPHLGYALRWQRDAVSEFFTSCVPIITWLCSRVMRFQSRPTNWPLLTIESPVAPVVRASD